MLFFHFISLILRHTVDTSKFCIPLTTTWIYGSLPSTLLTSEPMFIKHPSSFPLLTALSKGGMHFYCITPLQHRTSPNLKANSVMRYTNTVFVSKISSSPKPVPQACSDLKTPEVPLFISRTRPVWAFFEHTCWTGAHIKSVDRRCSVGIFTGH